MLFISVAAICLASCGGGEAPASTDSGSGAVATPSPSPTPSPTPTPGPAAPTGGSPTGQLAKVDSGINIDDWLYDTGIPDTAAPDVLGAFRFLCAPTHLSYDDPIVHPGQPGAAHLHQFFGNTEANANSTYESLRKSGDSSCTNVLNRSAYWMPALLDGQGSAIRPNYVALYYKRRPESDSWFSANGSQAATIPRGLKYVFGSPEKAVKFKCVNGWNPVGTEGSMTHALNQCSAGKKLVVALSSPSCWDGKNLDSADHRSHVAYEQRDGSRTFCPSSHPVVLARFTMTVEWSIEGGDTPALWRFSSDMNGAEPGSTFHADWFGAWEDSVMEMWHNGCIDELLNCSDGDLGMGRKMRRNELYPASKVANPRKVPLHTIPG